MEEIGRRSVRGAEIGELKGEAIESSKLAAALRTQCGLAGADAKEFKFSDEEVDAFELSALKADSFIKVDGEYFVQDADGIEVRERPAPAEEDAATTGKGTESSEQDNAAAAMPASKVGSHRVNEQTVTAWLQQADGVIINDLRPELATSLEEFHDSNGVQRVLNQLYDVLADVPRQDTMTIAKLADRVALLAPMQFGHMDRAVLEDLVFREMRDGPCESVAARIAALQRGLQPADRSRVRR